MVSRHSKADLSTSACMCMIGSSIPALKPRIMFLISFNSPFSLVFGLSILQEYRYYLCHSLKHQCPLVLPAKC